MPQGDCPARRRETEAEADQGAETLSFDDARALRSSIQHCNQGNGQDHSELMVYFERRSD
jgi:hypothetical protein